MNFTEVKNEEKELEINIPGMIMAILKRFWIVILAVIICGAGSFLYFDSKYVPVYKTKVGIYIIGNEFEPATGTAVQIATNIAKDYELLIKDPVVLEDVSKSLGEIGMKADVATLSRRISVESPENTRILWITVTWNANDSMKDDEMAKEVQTIADNVCKIAISKIPEITKVPASQVSPAPEGTLVGSSVLRNTVIFAFLGACIAALAIAVVYVLDDKISSRKDIEERLGLSVLGVIPNVIKAKKLADDGKYYGGKQE